jgi:hypothetical protein
MPQFVRLLTDATATIAAPTAVRRVVTITTVAAASLVDGDRFTVQDRTGAIKVFHFDKDGSVPTFPANQIRVDVSAALTADQVRDALIAAINTNGIDAVASSGGAATVTVTSNEPGADTLTVTENVANAGFIVAVTTAGTFGTATPAVAPTVSLGAIAARTGASDIIDGVAKVWSSDAATGVAKSVTLRLWGYDPRSRVFLPAGPGQAAAPDAPRGVLNLGQAIGEIAAGDDYIRYYETLRESLRGFSHLAVEVVAIANTTIQMGIEFP